MAFSTKGELITELSVSFKNHVPIPAKTTRKTGKINACIRIQASIVFMTVPYKPNFSLRIKKKRKVQHIFLPPETNFRETLAFLEMENS